jgi:hypothetical protein
MQLKVELGGSLHGILLVLEHVDILNALVHMGSS